MQDSIRDTRNGDFAWYNRSLLRLRLSWRANLVYMALASFANGDTQACFPSTNALGEIVGVKRDTVFRGLKELKSAGVIEIRERQTERGAASNEYVLLPIPTSFPEPFVAISDDPIAISDLPPSLIATPPIAISDTNKKKFNKKKINEINNKPKDKPSAEWVLPTWIDFEFWKDYEEMRRKINKPMTDRARELAVGKLKELEAAGHRHEDVLDQSVLNSWQGLFEIKKQNGGSYGALPGDKTNRNLAVLAESLARGKRQGRVDENGLFPAGDGRGGSARTLHGRLEGPRS